jgi:hypothetical protein
LEVKCPGPLIESKFTATSHRSHRVFGPHRNDRNSLDPDTDRKSTQGKQRCNYRPKLSTYMQSSLCFISLLPSIHRLASRTPPSCFQGHYVVKHPLSQSISQQLHPPILFSCCYNTYCQGTTPSPLPPTSPLRTPVPIPELHLPVPNSDPPPHLVRSSEVGTASEVKQVAWYAVSRYRGIKARIAGEYRAMALAAIKGVYSTGSLAVGILRLFSLDFSSAR